MKMSYKSGIHVILRVFEEGVLFRNIKFSFAVLSALGSFFLMPLASEIGNISLQASIFSEGTSQPVFGGEGLQGGAEIVRENIEGVGIIEEGNIVDTIIFIIKYVLIFAGILAFFAFIWAGFLYITSFTRDENTESAKKAMMYAAIGILIILFSWVIVEFLTTFSLEGN